MSESLDVLALPALTLSPAPNHFLSSSTQVRPTYGLQLPPVFPVRSASKNSTQRNRHPSRPEQAVFPCSMAPVLLKASSHRTPSQWAPLPLKTKFLVRSFPSHSPRLYLVDMPSGFICDANLFQLLSPTWLVVRSRARSLASWASHFKGSPQPPRYRSGKLSSITTSSQILNSHSTSLDLRTAHPLRKRNLEGCLPWVGQTQHFTKATSTSAASPPP